MSGTRSDALLVTPTAASAAADGPTPIATRVWLDRARLLALIVVILIAAARLVSWAWTQPVSFDGAMNLEVARSLAEGHGYRRMYADHSGFAHEIQTRAPYILPAAGVFSIFGVGLWQAQLVNLGYLFALALAAFLLVRRWASWRWGIAAAAVCLCTPGIEDIGLNGYGEVPAFVWWLFSLLVLYRSGDTQSVPLSRCLVAGVLIGIAVVTKTVLLIGLVTTLSVFVACGLQHWRRMPIAVMAILAGVMLPLLLHELWHASALGSVAKWMDWILDEKHAIRMQAGVAAGYSDTPGVRSKLIAHFGILASSIGVPGWLLALWGAGSALLLVVATRMRTAAAARPVLLSLAAFALIYFLWWLGVTPTQKAWYRRIFDGVVALEFVIVLAAATVWMNLPRMSPRVRTACIGLVASVLALQGLLAWENVSSNVSAEGNSPALAQDLAAIRQLPANASMYGIGWNSVSAIALYSGRHLDDIADATPADLAVRSPVYLLLAADANTKRVEDYWLQRYPKTIVESSDDLRIVRLTTDVSHDPFEGTAIDPATVRSYVNFIEADYPYTFGFHPREVDGWRWARNSVDALLRYTGEPTFAIDAPAIAPGLYRRKRGVAITVWVDNCLLGIVHADATANSPVRLSMKNCPLPIGRLARVRLWGDDVINALHDDRQLCFIVSGFGFEQAPPATSFVKPG